MAAAETTQKLNLSSKSVTIINEAVIKNKTLENNNSKSKQKVSSKKAISDPVVANFTVDGWPISKSRMAPNYVNYDEESATLVPNKPFTSDLARKFNGNSDLICTYSGTSIKYICLCRPMSSKTD